MPDGSSAVTPGGFFEGKPGFTLKNTADAASGVVDYALTLMQPAEPVSGDGVLGTIRFRALKDAAVTISLVSPEFTEVDGQKVAQRVNQVPVQIVQAFAPDAESAVALAPVVSAQNDPVSMFSNPALNNGLPASQGQPSHLPLIAAGVFFVAGLILLTLSVGMYSQMRVRYNVMAMKDIRARQVY